MIVYRDMISGDEMLSDAFTLKPVVEADGTVVEGLMCVESKNIVKGGGEIDIGCGSSFGGDDPDAAGGGSDVETVNNVVDAFQLTETQIGGANDFKAWVKEYMNAVVLKLREKKIEKEQIQAFKAGAPAIAKYFLTRFSDVQFYLGPSFCPESMVFSIYEDGAITPTFYYIMGGLVKEKF